MAIQEALEASSGVSNMKSRVVSRLKGSRLFGEHLAQTIDELLADLGKQSCRLRKGRLGRKDERKVKITVRNATFEG